MNKRELPPRPAVYGLFPSDSLKEVLEPVRVHDMHSVCHPPSRRLTLPSSRPHGAKRSVAECGSADGLYSYSSPYSRVRNAYISRHSFKTYFIKALDAVKFKKVSPIIVKTQLQH
jgi:hypothetical protein